MNRRTTGRASMWVGSVAMLALLFAMSPSFAAGPTGGTSVSEQQRLDALSGQMNNLAGEVNETKGEVKQIEKAITVGPPAEGAKPQTVGEHVSVVEKDLGDLKNDLSTNLGVHIHGLVDAGYEHNFNQPNGNVNLYRFADEDGFQLYQGNIHIDRTTESGLGFVTELNFGQVANTVSSVTNYSNVSHVGGQFFDPTQYYLTYTAPIGSGLALQAGRFVTLLGEEVIPTYQNQNYNQSGGLIFNLGIPFTQTGVRGTYTFNDYVAATGGLNNGWDDPGAFNNGGPMYEGELTLNNKDKTISLVLNGNWGPNAFGHSNSNLGIIDPVVTWKPWFVQNVTLASEYIYASQSGHVANGHSATWQALAGYIVYDWTPQWETASRGEFFDDEDGFRTGTTQTLWEFTQTLSYKVPGVNGLVTRLEYRHDNSNTHVFPNNNFVNAAGMQQLWRGQDTLGAYAIYYF